MIARYENKQSEPTHDERVERYAARCTCTVPCNTAHDCLQTPQAVFVDLSTDELPFLAPKMAGVELAEKDATIAALRAEVEQYVVAYPLALDRAQRAEAIIARVYALVNDKSKHIALRGHVNADYISIDDLLVALEIGENDAQDNSL